MRKVTIDRLILSPMNYQRLVLLKEDDGERYLPIWIGPAEADAIAMKLQGVSVPRPSSHDLLCSVISSLGADVNSIIINDLKDGIFYGNIVLDTSEGQLEIDARPSDAMALAVRVQAPIFADDVVLNRVGLLIDRESDQAVSKEMPEGESASDEELKRLSAYTDFINTLDMDDLGKGSQEE